jgi:succinoglycan biosynthesis transport protein ExoP
MSERDSIFYYVVDDDSSARDSNSQRQALRLAQKPAPEIRPILLAKQAGLRRGDHLDDGSEFHGRRILRVLRRNWYISLTFALTFIAAVIGATFLMKNTYESRARIEINPPEIQAVAFHETPNRDENQQDYLETQSEILKSDELAIAVIQELHLDQNPEFAGKGKLRSDILSYPTGSNAPEPNPLDVALKTFQSRLSVSQVRNSHLVEVSFGSYDARLSAATTNALVRLFIERNYKTRYEIAMQTSRWLSEALDDLRLKVEKSNQALVDYQRANNISVDMDSKENTITQRVADLNHQLTQAEADRMQLQAYMNMALGTTFLPQIHENPVLPNLTQRLAETRAQIAEAETVYGNKNSIVKKLTSEATELEFQLKTEQDRMLVQLKATFAAARTHEGLVAQSLDQMNGKLENMNEKMIQYRVLKNEAQANEVLYNTLFARGKEAAITAGLKSTTLRVVDQARVLDSPTRPHRFQIIALASIVGIFASLVLAFVKESLDDKIRTPEDIKQCTGLSPFGTLPLIGSLDKGGKPPLFAQSIIKLLGDGRRDQGPARMEFSLTDPHSPASESMRNLIASIKLSHSTVSTRIALVVSPWPREGKTTLAVNLALMLSEYGKTCIIDADLRKPLDSHFLAPTIAVALGVRSRPGLSDFLTGSVDLDTALMPAPGSKTLTVLPAGKELASPGQLIASELMRATVQELSKRFDSIIIDSPPLLPFADARMLSAVADIVILVGLSGSTTRQDISLSSEILEGIQAPLLGVVLNGVDATETHYRYYREQKPV